MSSSEETLGGGRGTGGTALDWKAEAGARLLSSQCSEARARARCGPRRWERARPTGARAAGRSLPLSPPLGRAWGRAGGVSLAPPRPAGLTWPGSDMADGSRQIKLAAAKKKLKEYQQKNSPGATASAKKKRKSKDGSRPETPTNDDRKSPENVSSLFFSYSKLIIGSTVY
uniref:Uncharacterized protein n=1 Tax=Chelonoidis abingdonii TaxID=106734 RepID=A0A8C0G2P4_CHEAB